MSSSYVRPSTSTNSFFYYSSISSTFVINLFIHLPQQISLTLALDLSPLHQTPQHSISIFHAFQIKYTTHLFFKGLPQIFNNLQLQPMCYTCTYCTGHIFQRLYLGGYQWLVHQKVERCVIVNTGRKFQFQLIFRIRVCNITISLSTKYFT